MFPSRSIVTMVLVAISTLSLAAEQQIVVPKPAPITNSRLLSTIQGQAFSSSGGQLANKVVRLRDVRFGRIVDSQITDKTGTFVFKTLEPGNYVVEMINPDRTVAAATQILNVNSGQVLSAVLKLPFRIPPVAGVLGYSSPSAAAVTSEAAASGVLGVTTAGEPISPGK